MKKAYKRLAWRFFLENLDFILKLQHIYCIIHHEKKISSGQGDRNL